MRQPLTVPEIQAAGGYQVLYFDCPWDHKDSGCHGAAEFHYECMTLDQLKQLPIGDIAANDSALFMWVCQALYDEAMQLGKHWGFKYKTKAFDWYKFRSNSQRPFYGNGRWSRAGSESVWLFTKGSPKAVNRNMYQCVETVDPFEDLIEHIHKLDDRLLLAALDEHSRKPPEVRQRIATMMGPHSSKLEGFARERFDGWDCYGNDPALGGSDVVFTPIDSVWGAK